MLTSEVSAAVNHKDCSILGTDTSLCGEHNDVSEELAAVTFRLYVISGDRGITVVKVLCYKSESRCFNLSWCHWNFSLIYNPSDGTMALGSTQSLTKMSTRSIYCGVKAAGA